MRCAKACSVQSAAWSRSSSAMRQRSLHEARVAVAGGLLEQGQPDALAQLVGRLLREGDGGDRLDGRARAAPARRRGGPARWSCRSPRPADTKSVVRGRGRCARVRPRRPGGRRRSSRGCRRRRRRSRRHSSSSTSSTSAGSRRARDPGACAATAPTASRCRRRRDRSTAQRARRQGSGSSGWGTNSPAPMPSTMAATTSDRRARVRGSTSMGRRLRSSWRSWRCQYSATTSTSGRSSRSRAARA